MLGDEKEAKEELEPDEETRAETTIKQFGQEANQEDVATGSQQEIRRSTREKTRPTYLEDYVLFSKLE